MLRVWPVTLALFVAPLAALAGPAKPAPAKPAPATPATPTTPAKPAPAAPAPAAKPAPATTPDTTKVAKDFVTTWLAAQNQGNFAAYEALYAPGFTGTKRVGKVQKTFDREGWLQDRKGMFRAPMSVEATELVVTGAPPIITIDLTQRWEQGTFADVGTKRLVIDVYRSADPILREDMLSSRKALARQSCLLALFPEARGGRTSADKRAAKVVEVVPLELGGEVAACRVDTREPEAEETQVVLAALAPSADKEHKRAGGWKEVGRQRYSFEDTKQSAPDDEPFDSEESLDVATLQAGPKQIALWVEKKRKEGGNMHSLRKADVGIWRATREGFDELLTYESWAKGGEADSGHECTLATLDKVSKGFFDLELTCVDSEGNWHSEDPDQNGVTESTETVLYRWDGSSYQERRRRSTPPQKN